MGNNLIITVARQYGSGGREVGEKLSKELSLVYHDKSLIKLAAEKSGMSAEILKNADEKATPSYMYSVAVGTIGIPPFTYGIGYDTPINDKLFSYQSSIIKEEAEKYSCVFVGRCADYILRDEKRLVKVFIYADPEKRYKTVSERQNISVEEAKSIVTKTDKRRANYYNYYTSLKWGKPENYNLMIDTTTIGTQGAVNVIKEYINNI